ncbi:hypothetical protein L6452_06194 [Arctium lappa]|uniref:Uncharacterized protein n=1 Tax=Arctium lappa TaxID=4217 RepID=A0ACB9EII5_ARCLA|nr:hypothetical protein L6452_06194 [Arctium lappa]
MANDILYRLLHVRRGRQLLMNADGRMGMGDNPKKIFGVKTGDHKGRPSTNQAGRAFRGRRHVTKAMTTLVKIRKPQAIAMHLGGTCKG